MVRVWDLATGRLLRQFEGHRGAVNAVAFARDGRSVISASEDATALVWDISDLTDHPAGSEPIPAQVLKARWGELAAADARAAYRATWALSVPSAVAFLQKYLHPATSPDPKGVPAATGPISGPALAAVAPRSASRKSRWRGPPAGRRRSISATSRAPTAIAIALPWFLAYLSTRAPAARATSAVASREPSSTTTTTSTPGRVPAAAAVAPTRSASL